MLLSATNVDKITPTAMQSLLDFHLLLQYKTPSSNNNRVGGKQKVLPFPERAHAGRTTEVRHETI